MSGLFDADAYKRNSLPKTFYRVTYPGSQARDEDTGDYVSDTNLEISDNLHLRQVAESHFYWRREPSPFVSVFSDKKHALNWAYKRVDRLNCGLDEVYISKIDTAKLPLGTRVFDATFLAGVLDIYHPYSEHEYLVLHRIPSKSITSTWNLQEIQEIQAADLAQMFAVLQVDEPVHSDTDGE